MEAIKSYFKSFKNNISKKQNKGIYMLMLLGCIGLLLISLSELIETDSVSNEIHEESYEADLSEIEKSLEVRISNEISKISGAGRTSVMLTMDSSKEYFYANNSEESIEEKEIKKEYELVTIEGKNGDEPIIIKTTEAKVRGILVICEGGDDPVVKEKIIESLCALLDIASNRISVAKMA